MNKLLAVQIALKAPKDMKNDFGHYKYRSCESILEELKPLLSVNELTLTLTDDIISIPATQVSSRIYVRATATLLDADKVVAVVTAYAREDDLKKGMDLCQITGAASSYARKYALNGMFLIDDTKDSDATNKHGKDEDEIKEPKAKVKDTPVNNMEKVFVEDVTRNQVTKLFYVKCSNRTFLTDKEVVALLSRGFKGKNAMAEYTIDTDMNAILVNISAVPV